MCKARACLQLKIFIGSAFNRIMDLLISFSPALRTCRGLVWRKTGHQGDVALTGSGAQKSTHGSHICIHICF
jgi:hypothetical protein